MTGEQNKRIPWHDWLLFITYLPCGIVVAQTYIQSYCCSLSDFR